MALGLPAAPGCPINQPGCAIPLKPCSNSQGILGPRLWPCSIVRDLYAGTPQPPATCTPACGMETHSCPQGSPRAALHRDPFHLEWPVPLGSATAPWGWEGTHLHLLWTQGLCRARGQGEGHSCTSRRQAGGAEAQGTVEGGAQEGWEVRTAAVPTVTKPQIQATPEEHTCSQSRKFNLPTPCYIWS